jgi:hypothetical protein
MVSGPAQPGAEFWEGTTMKSFWIGSIAAVIIAIIAGAILTGSETTAEQKFSTSNTRL